MNCFQTLLSNSTCAASTRRIWAISATLKRPTRWRGGGKRITLTLLPQLCRPQRPFQLNHHLTRGTLEARGSGRCARHAKRQATPGCRRRNCIVGSVLTSRPRNSCRKLQLDVRLEVREVLDVLLEVWVEVQSEAPLCSTSLHTFLLTCLIPA